MFSGRVIRGNRHSLGAGSYEPGEFVPCERFDLFSLAGLENGILQAIGLSVAGGYLGTVTVCSHIAADALTPAGVEPFAPKRDDWYSYDVAKASNPIANGVLLVIGGAVAVGSVGLGAWIHQLF